MSRLTSDGTAEPVSRDQILRRERGQGNNINFPCSAYHEQDRQPYPVDQYSAKICNGHNLFSAFLYYLLVLPCDGPKNDVNIHTTYIHWKECSAHELKIHRSADTSA